jgi:hypothetical protein
MSAIARSSGKFLVAGAVAGPLYVLVGLGQVLMREGFDPRKHALSQLSNGEFGWIQTANFFIVGALVILGAIGMRRALRGSPGATWGPILLGIYGIGMLGASAFAADPGGGFPPGVATPSSMSQSGLMHFVFGGIGFYALVGACFVFARRFKGQGQPIWAAFSIVTGLGFLASFIAISSGPPTSSVMLAFYAAVVWVWAWHAALHIKVNRESNAG